MLSMKRWECFPLELSEEGNEERDETGNLIKRLGEERASQQNNQEATPLTKQIIFAHFKAHRPFTFLS